MTLRVNPSVNYRVSVIYYQCRFISCKKCTALVGDVDNGGGCAWVGQGVCRRAWNLPLNFAVKPKTVPKQNIVWFVKNQMLQS